MRVKKKKQGIFEKAVVLTIVVVFIAGAFTPVAGLQGEDLDLGVSFEEEIVKLGDEETISKTSIYESYESNQKSDGFQVDDHNPVVLSRDVPWWNTDWQYRKEIIINHIKVEEDLSNFPVLLSFSSDGDLANNSKCQNNGDDIVFIDYSSNKLAHEINSYNFIINY